jgi:hypothetical protein
MIWLPGREQAPRDARAAMRLACGHATGQAPRAGQEHADGRHPGPTGEDQGEHPGHWGTSISGGQASVRICEGALPGAGQEHSAIAHFVCAVQSLDGAAKAVADSGGMSAPAKGRECSKRGVNACETPCANGKLPPYEMRSANSPESAGYADLP